MSNPFKRGDRVICLKSHSDFGLVAGNIYTVSEVAGDFVGINEISNTGTEWSWTRFAHTAPAAPTTEKTPDGIDQHAPGAKLDAGKLRPALVLDGFANALLAVVKVGTDGAAKYTDNGWREVTNGFQRYSDAEGRHRLYRAAGETHDKLSGSLHLAHEAWNALAKLELYLMENPE